MDIMQMFVAAASALFGAGTTYGVTKTKIDQHGKEFEAYVTRHDHEVAAIRQEVGEKLDRLDSKFDGLTNHIIQLASRLPKN